MYYGCIISVGECNLPEISREAQVSSELHLACQGAVDRDKQGDCLYGIPGTYMYIHVTVTKISSARSYILQLLYPYTRRKLMSLSGLRESTLT